MGVNRLWKILPKAASSTPLYQIALEHTLDQHLTPYKIGIDALLWLFHSQTTLGTGENSEIELFFNHCCRLLSMLVALLFVFDGQDQPEKLRNEKKFSINKKKFSENNYLNGIQAIIDSFGFESLTAPGEAEAALAQFSMTGKIDAILSDDIDCFLFRARTVLRSVAVKNSSYIEFVDIYSSDILDQAGFSCEALIFIALLRGGDYDTGLPGCGLTTAANLRTLGFGDTLKRNLNSTLNHFLDEWQEMLRKELSTNFSQKLSSPNKQAVLNISNRFPCRKVIDAYFNPSIFDSDELDCLTTQLWNNCLELQTAARSCEIYFIWGSQAGILKKFEKLVWPGVVFRSVLEDVQRQNAKNPIIPTFPLEIIAMKNYGPSNVENYRVHVPTKSLISRSLLDVEG
ncbi:hypothetical protein Clacol_003392 [Clathrus columnatus]|uniref:XPG-I domain-containing protein n=1 Tax=Clathrus columnatus TaxID=1419009 RepID=A0AAV5A870_9AGAM|nr:hypothetical protein Clacol_003392 [Clathrus columnatus]